MAAPLHPSLAITLGLGAFIAWRMASRVRRMIGRQRLTSRPWFSVVLFPVLVVLLAFVSLVHPTALLGLAAGCAVGIGLGIVGLRLTRFEAAPEGFFYTPNPYLGIALSVLLIARIGWRYLRLTTIDGSYDGGPAAGLGQSPLTLLLFGMLAGYYTTYAAGLLRWKHRSEPAAAPADRP